MVGGYRWLVGTVLVVDTGWVVGRYWMVGRHWPSPSEAVMQGSASAYHGQDELEWQDGYIVNWK